MYQTRDNTFKTTIQTTSIQLNTADGSPMTALRIAKLQLKIADFTFSHIFIICDRLPKTELLFAINVQKNTPYPMPGTNKELLHTKVW